jgi:hypothetical protein
MNARADERKVGLQYSALLEAHRTLTETYFTMPHQLKIIPLVQKNYESHTAFYPVGTGLSFPGESSAGA